MRTRVPGNRWFDLDPDREPLEYELLRALARPCDPVNTGELRLIEMVHGEALAQFAASYLRSVPVPAMWGK